MIRVGVIGLGEMGQHHARIYSQLDCELVGVADIDIDTAREIGNKFSCRYFYDYHDLLTEVDAVSIAVPTSLHREIATPFLESGIHCLLEKPIAATVEEGKALIEAAELGRAKLAVGHIERFNPAVQKLKSILDQGTLGQLMIITIRRVGPFVDRIRDVGVIIDSASHDVDVARYLMGREPIAAFCRSGRFTHPTEEDHAVIVLDFGDTTACIEANWFTPRKVRTLVITGSKGIAYLNYITQSLTLDTAEGRTIVSIEKAEPLKLELMHFLRCAKNGETPLVNGYEGLHTLDICTAAAQKRSNIMEDAVRIAESVGFSN